jgi:hypothetical protein
LDARQTRRGGAGLVDVVYVAVGWVVGLFMLVLFWGNKESFKEKFDGKGTHCEEIEHGEEVGGAVVIL